jgi:hypothetical protein
MRKENSEKPRKQSWGANEPELAAQLKHPPIDFARARVSSGMANFRRNEQAIVQLRACSSS